MSHSAAVVVVVACVIVFGFCCALIVIGLTGSGKHNAPRGSDLGRRSYRGDTTGYGAHILHLLGGPDPVCRDLLKSKRLAYHAGRLGWDQDRQLQVCRDFTERNRYGLDFDTFVEDEALYEEGGIVDLLEEW